MRWRGEGISHRFSTVRIADHILTLEDGRIRKAGSHQELMAHGGEYARLFSLQAEGYAQWSPGGVARLGLNTPWRTSSTWATKSPFFMRLCRSPPMTSVGR